MAEYSATLNDELIALPEHGSRHGTDPHPNERKLNEPRSRRAHSNTALRHMTRSHLIVLIVPIAVLAMVLWFALRTGDEEAIRMHERQATHIQQLADAWVGEAESTAVRLAFDPMVRAVLSRAEPNTPGYFKVWQLAFRMPSYELLDDVVVGAYVFLRETDVGVTSGSAFQDVPVFLREVLRYDGPLPGPWEDLLWHRFHAGRVLPSAEVRIGGRRRRVIPYLQSIPIDHRDEPRGVVFILIDEHRMLGVLQQASLPESSVFVVNPHGEVITSLVRPGLSRIPRVEELRNPERRPADLLVAHARSETLRWEFYSVTPTGLLRTAAHRLGVVAGVAFAVAAAIGLVAAYLASMVVARPIDEALDRLRAEIGGSGAPATQGEFALVAEGLNALLRSNAALRRDVNRLIVLARHSFLYQMAHDELRARDDAARTALSSQPLFPYQRHVVCVCRFEPGATGERGGPREFLAAQLHQHLPDGTETYELSGSRLACLTSSCASTERECVREISVACERAAAAVEAETGIRLLIACGRVFRDLSDAGHSFADAIQVMMHDHLLSDRTAVLWVSSLPPAASSYHYPIETELALVSAVKSADKTQVCWILNEVRQENLRQRVLTPASVSDLLAALRTSIARYMTQLVESRRIDDRAASLPALEAMQEAMKEMALEEAFDHLVIGYVQACEIVERAEEVQRNEMSRRLAEYLEETYHEVDLNLYKVAKRFDMSEHGLYRFFRTSMGESFASYLQNLRITNARELLHDSELSVKAIATMVGYASDTSFRRSFKRVTGLTPVEYREALKTPIHATSP